MNKYFVIAMGLTLLICAPIIIRYELKKITSMELAAIASMSALSSVGRIAFAALPGFKPSAALIIISGAGLGWEAGFITGVLTAVISNMYFGQGPWTLFQMAAWGFIGMTAGLLGKHIKSSRPFMLMFGAASGVVFSLIMDIYTLLFAGEGFTLGLYAAAVTASLPFTVTYAVSDVVFLLLLGRPICRKLARLKLKYF